MPNPKRRPLSDISDEEEAAIQAMIAVDEDNPELTDEEIAQLRPAREVLPPALYEALTRRGRDEGRVVPVNLDRDVVERFQARGGDWQERINQILRKAVDARPARTRKRSTTKA